MSMAGIRDAIKAALEAIVIDTDTAKYLKAYDTAPESIGELPAAYILPISGEYNLAAGGQMTHKFEVILLVQRGGSIAEAQDTIDAYLSDSGASSIKAAVDGASLGAHADVIWVSGYRNYGGMEFAGQLYLGCKFDVTVIV